MYLQEMLAEEEQAAVNAARAAQPQLLPIHPHPSYQIHNPELPVSPWVGAEGLCAGYSAQLW